MAEDVTIEELEFLAASTKMDFGGMRPVDICRQAMMGKSIIWRFTGDNGETGIVVTRGVKQPNGSELFIQHLGGVGLIKNAKFIFGELEKFGREHNFRWMTGNAIKPMAALCTRRLGFNQATIQIVKEI